MLLNGKGVCILMDEHKKNGLGEVEDQDNK